VAAKAATRANVSVSIRRQFGINMNYHS